MKTKQLLLILASGLLAACSSSDDVTDIGNGGGTVVNPNDKIVMPETQLFAGISNSNLADNGLVSVSASSQDIVTNVLPEAKTDNGYFTVRVDGYLNQVNSNGSKINMNDDYYPLPATTAGGRVVPQLKENTGLIYTNYPTIEYKQDLSKNMSSYVFSKDGSATATVMRNVPTMEDVLKAKVNEATPNIVLDYDRMPADVNKDNLHIIWYVVKLINIGDKLWHVDGVLTDLNDLDAVKARTPAMDFWETDEVTGLVDTKFDPNNAVLRYENGVEVDIHQQKHQDWGEIKTSIHVKTPEDVKITLPVTDKLIVDNPEIKDDVRLRDFELPISLESYNNKFFANVNVKVERDENGVYISVTGLTPVVLKAIEDQYADGLTVEIHTFTKFDDTDAVWNQLCNSKVETAAKVSGQITSAYKPNATDKRTFNEKGEAVSK